MADSPIAPRPWWVNFFVKPGSRRSAVRTSAFSICLLVLIALLLCSEGLMSESVLGRIAFVIGAVMVPFGAVLAIGVFLSLRWLDRNGGWQ
jgi:uncharacterized membrane protein